MDESHPLWSQGKGVAAGGGERHEDLEQIRTVSSLADEQGNRMTADGRTTHLKKERVTPG